MSSVLFNSPLDPEPREWNWDSQLGFFPFLFWWAGMVGPEGTKWKEGLKGLVTQRELPNNNNKKGTSKDFPPYFQSGTILSMQSHMSRQSKIAVIEAELGFLDTYSFNILCIFSCVLRWLLKPLHRMQFKTPLSWVAWWCPLLSSAGCWGLASAAGSWGQKQGSYQLLLSFGGLINVPFSAPNICPEQPGRRDIGSGLGSRREEGHKGWARWGLWASRAYG